jgi:chromosome segregation ATPase
VTAQPPAPKQRPTTWIVLTAALGAAVIGLAIWAAVLQSDQDDVNEANAARIEELEQENARLQQQIADLEQELADAQAGAEEAAAQAQADLEAAREQYESVAADLGATNAELAESQAELERLADEAEAALAEAEGAAGSAQAEADAQRARADLAEACLAAVADVIQRIYAAADPAEALDEAAAELEEIADDCGRND